MPEILEKHSAKFIRGAPFTTGSRQVLVWPPVTVGMEIHTVPCLKSGSCHVSYQAGGKNGYEIAGAKDVGMIRNGIKNIERRENMGAEDREFLAFPSVLWRTPKYRRVAEYAFKQDYGKIPAGSCYGI